MNQSQLLIRCPTCNKIPLVTLIELPTLQIDIHCSCSFHQTYPIQTYLSNIDNETTPTPQIKSYSKCSEHLNGVIQYYCLTCKKHFCYIDFHLHEHCKYINLKSFYSDERVDSILENFSIAKKEIMTYNDTIKNQIVQSLKEKAASVEECFQKKIEKIHEMFATIMINNYMSIPTNYYVLSNLMNHSHFKVEKCLYKKDDTSLKNIQIITKYFNTAQILDYVPDSVNSYFFKQKNTITKTGESSIDSNNKGKTFEEKYLMKTIIEDKAPSYLELAEKGKLISFIGDNKFKLYDLSTFNSIEIDGNELVGQVISILSNGNIISIDKNGVYIWNIIEKTIKLKGTIQKVNKEIYDAKLVNDKTLAFCSYKKKIQFVSINPQYEEVYSTIRVSDNVLSYLKIMDKEVLACCSVDANLAFYYLPTSKKLAILKDVECCGSKSMFEFKDKNLLVGGPNIITIIDADTYNIKKRIKNDIFNGISAIYSFKDNSDIIVLGCMKGNMLQLDLKKEKVITNIQAHSYQINGLNLIGRKIMISFSGEPFVKIWNFNN